MNVYPVKVACPECGDRNRKARRACRTCDRTGLVGKNLPGPWEPVSDEGGAR